MKKRLLLIRHAQSLANSQGIVQGWMDSPLSDFGHYQAQQLSQRLRQNFNITRIFTSPLSRAAQTASYLSRTLNLPLIFNDNLKERNLGPISGLHKEQIKVQFPQIENAWINNLPRPHLEGAETDAQFARRVEQSLQDILSGTESNATVAIISHGGTLNRLVSNSLKLDPAGRFFSFSNASLTILDIYNNNARLVLLNDHCHIEHSHPSKTQTALRPIAQDN